MELAYAGLHQLCAPLLGRLGSLAEPQRRGLSVAFGLESLDGDAPDQFLVALAALGLMAEASEEQPLLCVVDDAQWLDQASAQVLGFVGRRLLAESIALVFADRTPTALPDPPAGLPGTPAGLPGTSEARPDPLAGLPELRLGGLGAAAARALLAKALLPRHWPARRAGAGPDHRGDRREPARPARARAGPGSGRAGTPAWVRPANC